MLAVVAGGNLQGIEAVYLAKKAGWDVRLIDRKSSAPASGLSDQFVHLDIADGPLKSALEGADLVLPALEDREALAALGHWTRVLDIPFVFDAAAYDIASSKSKSNRLFSELGLPVPRPWPHCPFPVVVKPDRGSGSHGVQVFHEKQDLIAFIEAAKEDMVIQEFIDGQFYSVEVLGSPDHYTPLQLTRLEMDAVHDCKRVMAPTHLPDATVSEFMHTAETLAHSIGLKGIMDIETILRGDEMTYMEIDARLPSQTPTAVYWSTGINMVQMLGDLFLNRKELLSPEPKHEKAVILEHVKASPSVLEVMGERIMSGARSLHVKSDFFGADEAITTFKEGDSHWVATLIFCGKDHDSVRKKRDSTIDHITRHLGIETYLDLPRRT